MRSRGKFKCGLLPWQELAPNKTNYNQSLFQVPIWIPNRPKWFVYIPPFDNWRYISSPAELNEVGGLTLHSISVRHASLDPPETCGYYWACSAHVNNVQWVERTMKKCGAIQKGTSIYLKMSCLNLLRDSHNWIMVRCIGLTHSRNTILRHFHKWRKLKKLHEYRSRRLNGRINRKTLNLSMQV